MNKRSFILTLNFAVIFPGLGHLYNGKIILSLLILFFMNFSSLLIYILISYYKFKIIIVLLLLSILFYISIYIFNIFHSIYLAKKQINYNKKFYNRWYYYFAYIFISFLIFYIHPNFNKKIFTYVYKSGAMNPALLIDEYIFGLYGKYVKLHYNRGDIVIYITQRENKIESITRIVGLPSDKVYFKDNNLYINDSIIQNDVIKFDIQKEQMDYIKKLKNEKYLIIPDNHYLILGDNKLNSYDSRYYGPIEAKYIIGKPLIIYYSKDRSRIFKILNDIKNF